MSDTSSAAPRFRGPQWELERAQMLFLAWRLGDPTLRALLEAAMRSYARRSPAFTAQLNLLVQLQTQAQPEEDDYIAQRRPPSMTSGVIAQALASAWTLGDPSFRPDLEDAIRQYARADPSFKQALASIQWPKPPQGTPS